MRVRRPLLIDWYCCEGGAAKGYSEAGFDIIGIDDKPQPKYPFAFIQCRDDKVDPRLIALADAHHASPPCQFGTALNNDKSKHVNRIPWIRKTLLATGKPFVIENVMAVANAGHLHDWVSLTGTMFDMHCIDSQGRRFDLSRERAFETSFELQRPWEPGAQHPIANVFGGHFRVRSGEFRTGGGTGRTVDLPGEDRRALARELMQMPWSTMKGMSEAIPPPMTEYVGDVMMAHIQGEDPVIWREVRQGLREVA